MSKTLYLVRHAQVESQTPWRFLGQGERALSAQGVMQAQKLAAALSAQSFDALFCSPLGRCRDTMAPVAKDRACGVEYVGDLAEISLGAWEGLCVEDVRRRFPGAYEARGADLAGYRPPGGESFADLRIRAATALAHMLAAPGRRLLAVTHAGVIRMLLCEVLGVATCRAFAFGVGYASLSCLVFDGQEARLRFFNVGLEGLAP